MRSIIMILIVLTVSTLGHAVTLLVPSQFRTIQAAIDAAVDKDEVHVAPGTYVENINFKGKAITVWGVEGPDVTIIDGGQPSNPSYGSVVVFENGEGLDSILDGFCITNGSGTLGVMGFHDGGGIYCDVSSPTIINNIISGNSISGNFNNGGGGISCHAGSPDIINNTISGNSADEGGGMIFYIQSSPRIENNIITNNHAEYYSGGIEFFSSCSPTIINNLIANNTVAQYNGGGILMSTYCSGNITGNTISGNSVAGFGGGIYCEKNSSPTISNNIISANASDKSGAGICCKENCSPTLTYNAITNNTATKHGGGIQFSSSTLLIANNVISGNTCVLDGGGISTSNESSVIINNIISGNKADHGGGYDGWYCSPTMMNNTFYGNIAATYGGAISCTKYSSMSVTNSIFWNNNAPAGPEIWIGDPAAPSTFTISYSDVDGGAISVLVGQNCTLNWGPGMINAYPVFAATAENDFHILYTSPCKDTGDNITVTELTDFEGDPRIGYGTVDMGADECYTHLYFTGNATPGGSVNLKFLGMPGISPVGLFIAFAKLDPPWKSMWGDWYLDWPWMGPIVLGMMPSPDGHMVIPGTLPGIPPGPYTLYMQAIIGDDLTNLCEMIVK